MSQMSKFVHNNIYSSLRIAQEVHPMGSIINWNIRRKRFPMTLSVGDLNKDIFK